MFAGINNAQRCVGNNPSNAHTNKTHTNNNSDSKQFNEKLLASLKCQAMSEGHTFDSFVRYAPTNFRGCKMQHEIMHAGGFSAALLVTCPDIKDRR